ncbi:MAG: hypothetical protein V1892_02140 [bacterium]
MSIENPNLNQGEQKEIIKEEFETRNFNDTIMVRVTDRGKEILKEKGVDYLKENEEGWTEIAHSDLMKIFGEEMTVGSFVDHPNKKFQLPIEPDYRIKKLKEKK